MPEDFYRIKRLPPYVFSEVNALKAQARAAGRDVIDLGMGNPDGPTPSHNVAKLVEAAQNPKTHGYSVSRGIAWLRRACAGMIAAREGFVNLDRQPWRDAPGGQYRAADARAQQDALVHDRPPSRPGEDEPEQRIVRGMQLRRGDLRAAHPEGPEPVRLVLAVQRDDAVGVAQERERDDLADRMPDDALGDRRASNLGFIPLGAAFASVPFMHDYVSASFMFDEEYALQPGATLALRYRVVIGDGEWSRPRIEECMGLGWK